MRKFTPRRRSSCTECNSSSVRKAKCCTPGVSLCQSRYSSIWLLRRPSAGSLIGILMTPKPESITLDINEVYSVEMSASSKCLNNLNPRTSEYHSTQWFILPNSTLPTKWSTNSRPQGFCWLYSFSGKWSTFSQPGPNRPPARTAFKP